MLLSSKCGWTCRSYIGRISAGIDLYATDRVELRLQYDGSFADGQTSNGGQFRFSYFF